MLEKKSLLAISAQKYVKYISNYKNSIIQYYKQTIRGVCRFSASVRRPVIRPPPPSPAEKPVVETDILKAWTNHLRYI